MPHQKKAQADETVEEHVEVVGVTPKAGKDKPIELEARGSGVVQVRTNGWVKLDSAALAQFEKALRRARSA
jgi:hypothetical protein